MMGEHVYGGLEPSRRHLHQGLHGEHAVDVDVHLLAARREIKGPLQLPAGLQLHYEPVGTLEPTTMIHLRPAHERGHADHGWLKSWFSFSFADYYDPMHMHFGALRVINDDVVAAGGGFGMHPHRDMEIVTYMLRGALRHQDSIGNGSLIRPGEVQKMSAGTGIMHGEMNPDTGTDAHLLQIWIFPSQKDLKPDYEQVQVPDELKRGRLHLIAAPEGGAHTVSLHQDARIYAGCFDADESWKQTLEPTRRYYLQVARGQLRVNQQEVNSGDGLMLTAESELALSAGRDAEILLFDLA